VGGEGDGKGGVKIQSRYRISSCGVSREKTSGAKKKLDPVEKKGELLKNRKNGKRL